MTARTYEALVAVVFAIAVLSGLVYAEVSKVDTYQGIAGLMGRTLGFGCQLRVYRTGGRIGGFVPSVSPNSFFPLHPVHVTDNPGNSLTEMRSSFGAETIVVRFRQDGEPVEYEFHRGNRAESSVYCRDLEFEVSGSLD